MARLWPFSESTARLLERPPEAGETHRWLARAACGLSRAMTRDNCARFLREVCARWVTHRQVPEREIAAAVALAYESAPAGPAGRKPSFQWPACDKAERDAALATCVAPLFDGVTDTSVRAAEALGGLFGLDEVICGGYRCETAVAATLESYWGPKAAGAQFVCPNPLKGSSAVPNKEGKLSVRCQANVAARRWIVAEFDDPALGRAEQAKIGCLLGRVLPLKMAVDSGGKSLHCWYACAGLNERGVALFFAWAVSLGADPSRWDPCGWVRMPGGVRRKADGAAVRQKVVYWNAGKTLNAQRPTPNAQVERQAGNG